MAKERGLGLGFGENQERRITLEMSFPVRAMLTEEAMRSLSDERKSLSAALSPESLGMHIADILLDKDVTDLEVLLPNILRNLKQENITLLQNAALIDGLDESLKAQSVEHFGISLEKMSSISVDEFVTLPPKLLALTVPTLMARLPLKEAAKLGVDMADYLPRDFLNALLNKEYFTPQLAYANEPISRVVNNGRTIQAFGIDDSSTKLHYRGRDWCLNHTHIHPGHTPQAGSSPEREYYLYENLAHMRKVQSGQTADPNSKVVAEIHTIFVSGDASDKRFMAVGAQAIVGSHNNEFQSILDAAKGLTRDEPIIAPSASLSHLGIYGEGRGGKFEEFAYDSWASLRIPDMSFQAGIRFLLSREPVEISTEQQNELHQLIPHLERLSLKQEVKPIGRTF